MKNLRMQNCGSKHFLDILIKVWSFQHISHLKWKKIDKMWCNLHTVWDFCWLVSLSGGLLKILWKNFCETIGRVMSFLGIINSWLDLMRSGFIFISTNLFLLSSLLQVAHFYTVNLSTVGNPGIIAKLQ